jgi:hypothetical protein
MLGGETVVVQKAVSGIETNYMFDWTRRFLDRHRDDGPPVLVMDCLGCHRNWTVLRQLQEAGDRLRRIKNR